MDAMMNEQVLIQLLTGPVGALALCLIAIFVIGRWVGQHLPKWVERHLSQFDRLIEQHQEDRDVYQQSVRDMTVELNAMGQEVRSIKNDVVEIKAKVK